MPIKPKQRRKKTYEQWTDDGREVLADVHTDSVYMESRIRLFPPARKKFEEGKLESLGRDIVHEFCHFLTDPLYLIASNAVTNKEGHFLEDTRERSTQEMAVVIWSLLPKKIFSPYK